MNARAAVGLLADEINQFALAIEDYAFRQEVAARDIRGKEAARARALCTATVRLRTRIAKIVDVRVDAREDIRVDNAPQSFVNARIAERDRQIADLTAALARAQAKLCETRAVKVKIFARDVRADEEILLDLSPRNTWNLGPDDTLELRRVRPRALACSGEVRDARECLVRTRLTTKLRPRRAGFGKHARVSRIDLLEQDRWWVDGAGNWHDVRKIDGEYRGNLMAYLLRNAQRIRFVKEWTTIRGPYGDDNLDERWAGDQEWMKNQALFISLKDGKR